MDPLPSLPEHMRVVILSEQPEMSLSVTKDEDNERDLDELINKTGGISQSRMSMGTGMTFDSRDMSKMEEYQPLETLVNETLPHVPTKPPTFSVEEITEGIIGMTFAEPFPHEILATEVQKLFTMHKQLRGSFKISLAKDSEMCNGHCKAWFLLMDLIHLDCGHKFCRSCMTHTLTLVFNDRQRYSDIKCPVCLNPFSPLDESIATYLEKGLMDRLIELNAREGTVCCPNSKCGYPFAIEPTVMPVSKQCPKCKKKFCTYCFGKPHLLSCDLYHKDMKRGLKS